jgi:acetyl-CoA synthetase
VAWTPTEAFRDTARVGRLMQRHGITTFAQLRERSIDDVEWFWDAVVEDLEIPFHTPYTQVLDTSDGVPWARWFVGGRLNLAHVCVDRWVEQGDGDLTALTWAGENGDRVTYTYAELAREIDRLAGVLAGQGVGPGDRVVCYLPMIPVAAGALFAVAKLGAVHVPVFSGFGAAALVSRLRDSGAAVVITADGTYRRGATVELKSTVDAAVRECEQVRSVLVVERTGAPVPMTQGRDHRLADLLAAAPDHREALWVDSETPVLLAYTSGTTGRPKGAVHAHGGFVVKIAEEAAYQTDIGPGDVLLWPTDMGWLMGPWAVVGATANGASVVLLEGAPDHPAPDRLWEVCAREGVTVLGCSPTLIRSLQARGDEWPARHDLSRIRVFASTGEPWNPTPWWWLFETVGGSERPIVNFTGGTEVGACFLSPHPLEPITPVSVGGPALGMAVDVVDATGASVRGEVGELVCRKPWPGMTRGVWGDRERYLEAYWSRYPGMWWHGDFASVDDDGFWFLHGRSDDTMNVAGKRIGPAEVESVLVAHPAVQEAAVVGVPDPVKGQALFCLVLLVPQAQGSEELRAELHDAVVADQGKAFAPRAVRFTTDLPRTRSAKIVRRLVRAVLLDEEPGDLSGLENPESVHAVARAW